MASAEMWVGGSSPSLRKQSRVAFMIFTWLLTLLVGGLILWRVPQEQAWTRGSVLDLVFWIGALATLNLFDLRSWGGRALSPDVPIIVAIALLFPPATAGLIGFLGATDRREFLPGANVTRFVFNRTQCAILTSLPALAVRTIPVSLGHKSALLAGATVVLAVFTFTNYLLVAVGARLADGVPMRTTVKNLRLGSPLDFAITWSMWGLLGMLLVAAEETLGAVAAIAFTLPALCGQLILARSDSALLGQRHLASKTRALAELSRTISDERKDERERVAAHLHDEVLQPLYQVALMCDVVKQDSQTGRLLELDRDVPLLRLTADIASKNLRGVIGRLRNSPLGLRGLGATLRGLVSDLALQTSAHLKSEIHDTPGLHPELQLIVYQVAKEALSNALRHARASEVAVRLIRDADAVRLSVEDNGVGFDPRSAQHDHFGLLIMRERTESVSGTFLIDSILGKGTIVAARFPLDGPES